ncbi:MAG: hypothetical protein CMO55_25150 [Verrucomicrobiales bacterium]|nr:hypothetical protein [Verrucomicrobiales bacterium]
MNSPDNRLELLKSFLSKGLPPIEFYQHYGVSEDEMAADVVRLLEHGKEIRDGDWIEEGMGLGWSLPGKFPENAKGVVEELVTEDFHRQHEDMISLLQGWRSTSSIPALVAAIELKPELEYLAYDDYGAYYKKCLWALVAIGTPEAKALVEGYTRSPIPELQEEAVYRFGKFDDDAAWSAASPKEKERLDTKREREAQVRYQEAFRNRGFWIRFRKGLMGIPWALRAVVLGLWFGGAAVMLCCIVPVGETASGVPVSAVELRFGRGNFLVYAAGFGLIMEGVLLYFGSRAGRAILFISAVLSCCSLVGNWFAVFPVLWWAPAVFLIMGVSTWFLFFFRPMKEFFDQK